MAVFNLTSVQMALLASALAIGLERCTENHVDAGGENTQKDLQAIDAVLAEFEAGGLSAEITVMAVPTEEEVVIETDDDLSPEELELQSKGSWGTTAYQLHEETGDERLRTVM